MLQDFNCGSLHILAFMCAIHCASGFPIEEGKYGQDCAGVLSSALQRACQVQGVFPFSRTVDLCSQEPCSCSNGRLLVWPLCLCLYGVHRSRENPIKRCIFSNQHWPLAIFTVQVFECYQHTHKSRKAVAVHILDIHLLRDTLNHTDRRSWNRCLHNWTLPQGLSADQHSKWNWANCLQHYSTFVSSSESIVKKKMLPLKTQCEPHHMGIPDWAILTYPVIFSYRSFPSPQMEKHTFHCLLCGLILCRWHWCERLVSKHNAQHEF